MAIGEVGSRADPNRPSVTGPPRFPAPAPAPIPAWDLLASVVSRLGEADVIEGILEFFDELCAPRSMQLVEILEGSPTNRVNFPGPPDSGQAINRSWTRPGPDGWREGSGSFCLRLRNAGETVAGLAVVDVRHPEHLDKYLNLSLAVSGVLGLALANARSRAELQRSEERFRKLADQSQEAIWRLEWEPTPHIAYLSPSFELITGFSAESVLADPGVAAVLWPGWNGDPTEPRRLNSRFEVRVTRPDGNIAILEIRSSVVPGGLQGLARDVTTTHELRESLAYSQRRHRGMAGVLDEGIVVQDSSGRVIEANDSAARILGMQPEQLLGLTSIDPLWRVVHEDGSDFAVSEHPPAVTLATGRGVHDVIMGVRRPDDTVTWVLVNSDWVVDRSDPQARIAVSSFTDITTFRGTQAELAASNRLFQVAFERGPQPMAFLSASLRPRFERVNEALCDFLGCTSGELLGHSALEFLQPDDRDAFLAAVRELGNVVDERSVIECRFRDEAGSTKWARVTITPLLGSDDRNVLCQFQDVTAIKHSEQALTVQELHDPLTGMPNRALLMEHITGALARVARSGRLVGVAFLDLDGFRAVNDSLGQEAGDELLVKVSDRISSALRGSDFAARIGGDEFVLVCEGLNSAKDVGVLARTVQRALSLGVVAGGRRFTATASIGIATGNGRTSAEELLREADSAMCAAKSRGGNRWESADQALHDQAVRMLDVESELQLALHRDELRLYYQPIVDLRTGTLTSVEALLRWEHPTRGRLTPEQFLDVAEQRNLMPHIGAWVLRAACAKAASWLDQFGRRAPRIAVNVSPLQMGDGRLDHLVVRTLTTYGLPADRIRLEIAENLPLTREHRADLLHVVERGVQLAIDDFGTGHTGYDYLRSLPVSQFKIDRSFVAGLGVDPTDSAIVASLLALGETLRVGVVAEGVENKAQAKRLEDLGCQLGQGWLWSVALPESEIDSLVAAEVAGGGRSWPQY